jgi:hypothetical protein
VQYDGQSPENRVDAMAFLEYRIGPAVGINTTFRYDAELNSVFIPAAPQAPPPAPPVRGDDLQFSRYQVYLGVRWFL